MRCAMISTSTNIVVNVIIADPLKDPHPDGTILVASDLAEIGWVYNPETLDILPPAPHQTDDIP